MPCMIPALHCAGKQWIYHVRSSAAASPSAEAGLPQHTGDGGSKDEELDGDRTAMAVENVRSHQQKQYDELTASLRHASLTDGET